jgi:hypothetical protein
MPLFTTVSEQSFHLQGQGKARKKICTESIQSATQQWHKDYIPHNFNTHNSMFNIIAQYYFVACTGLFHMLSLLANDYLAHRVELLEAEEQITEMIRNISMNDNAIGVPEAPGRQTMPSATIASQEISGWYNCKYICFQKFRL